VTYWTGASDIGGDTDFTVNATTGVMTVGALDTGQGPNELYDLPLASGADADSSETDTDSGLEIVSTGLTLLRGCSDNNILKWDETADDWNCEADATGAGGSAIVFDIGDDGGDDSVDLNEIATTGDTNTIFTESAADKMLIAVGNNWPTSDLATTLTITDNESTAESNAVIFTSGGDLDGGDLGLECDGTFNYNPSTGTVTSTAFVGALTGAVTGNADTATALAANPADCAANEFADAIAASGDLTCNAIVDADVPDTITIDLSTLATTLTITDNENTAENNAVIFTSGGDLDGGDLGLECDGTFYYTPSTGVVTATGFAGALTGAASDVACTDCIDGTDLSDTITLDANLVIAGAFSHNYGNNTATTVTIDTDGTGDAELVLPTDSVSGTELSDDTVDGTELVDNITVDTLTIGDGVPTNYTAISNTGAITQAGSATLTLQDGSDLIITANDDAGPFLSATQADTMSGVLTTDGLTVTTTNAITVGVVQWDDGSDNIDGEKIAADTIDDDSIDFVDVTCADITTTDCGPITSTGANTIGNGSAAVTVNATTGIELTTSATECIYLDAGGITCLGTGGCTDPADTDGTNFSFKTAAFATGADDCGSWVFEVPSNFTGTTASVTFVWFSDHADCTGGAEDEVCWTIDGDSFANDAAFETAALAGTLVGITSDICTADGDIMRTAAVTFTHSMSANQTGVVLVCRDVDGGNCTGDDDYGQDAKLRSVAICYEASNTASGE
jgi:hypothetical protein